MLQRRGLIKYQRGKVKILDRAELETAACGCYQITKELYAGLYRQPVGTVDLAEEAAGTKADEVAENAGGAGKSGRKGRAGKVSDGSGAAAK